jgi:hypothetical protein
MGADQFCDGDRGELGIERLTARMGAAGSALRRAGNGTTATPRDLHPVGRGVDEPPGVDHDSGRPGRPGSGDDLLGRLGDEG